ncbi:MAG: hypothetical protein MJ172_06255 [Clostridia bacterium]|nr:hypothetical protein [Clostridia bacterium]
MACFLVPCAEAIVMKAVEKKASKKSTEEVSHISMTRKLGWLSNMLFGGSALLAFEHVWHGEITPWAPFVTAMGDSADMVEMFHEMATVGVTMAVIITIAWAGIVAVANRMEKQAKKEIAKA